MRSPLRELLPMSVLFLIALPAAGDPIVDISENDGQPVIQADPRELRWDFQVNNNSDHEPAGAPYDQNVTEIHLYDLFSTQEPTFDNLPSLWNGSATPAGEQLWDITLSTLWSFEYLEPGDHSNFDVFTYRPTGTVEITTGTLYGQGRLEHEGLQPPAPGDAFVGPTGYIHVPVPVVDIRENDGQPVVYADPTELGWRWIIRNNSDVEPLPVPYAESITEVRLYGVYSSEMPHFGDLPPFWEGAAYPVGQDRWDLELTVDNFLGDITPGTEEEVSVRTYRPTADYEIVIADLYGQGRLEHEGWQPPSPGDEFAGPACLKHPFDVDNDCDIDGDDLLAFEECASGPAIAFEDDCGHFDPDVDGDIDQSDFGVFQCCYGGDGNAIDLSCSD